MSPMKAMWVMISFHLTALCANLIGIACMMLGYLPYFPVIGTVFIVMLVQVIAMIVGVFYAVRINRVFDENNARKVEESCRQEMAG